MAYAPGTNFYVNNFQNNNEQLLIEDLIIEAIKFYGIDLYYIPRKYTAVDKVYTEDPSSTYGRAYPIEMYIRSVDGFQGDGDFLSKFGVEIRDRVTFTVARRIWLDEIGRSVATTRPYEGDLIWLPLNNKPFKITFVEHESVFYQLGALQTFELTCELFEYSNETFDTGIPEIDHLMNKYSTDLDEEGLLSEDGDVLLTEEGLPVLPESATDTLPTTKDDSDFYQGQGYDIIDFSEHDPLSEGKRY
jgi:hypothetical protein